MAAPLISALIFDRLFSRFARLVEEQSGEPFVSFQEGLPFTLEDYKGPLRDKARQILRISNWKAKDVGTGRILKHTQRAIEISGPKGGVRNNLVRWPNRYGADSQSHKKILDAVDDPSACRSLERLLFRFFNNKVDDATAFEEFIELVGRKYDLLAYLFFLKNWNRYMPILTTTFDKAFALLGVDLKTAKNCSWDNYVAFNDSLRAVQKCLKEIVGLPDVRLVDAHSFCWMLVRLELPDAIRLPTIPTPLEMGDLGVVNKLSPAKGVGSDHRVITAEEFAQRDAERLRLGQLAEDVAIQSERKRLKRLGHPNPDEVVKAVWNEPGRGYDILSCELDGTPRFIEVKACQKHGGDVSFILSDNEWQASQQLPNYFFYLVFNADSQTPKVRMTDSLSLLKNMLTSLNYRATFSAEL